MEIINIDDFPSLANFLTCFPNNYIFRGQSNSDHNITSSLERLLKYRWNLENIKKYESFALSEFKSRFALYNQGCPEPDSRLSWLAAMQHYGIPTRLVDFTTSPLVALYYALESYPLGSNDSFSVYAVDYKKIFDISVEKLRKERHNFNYSDSEAYSKRDEIYEAHIDNAMFDILWVTEPAIFNARLDRQEGTFMVAGKSDTPLQKLIESELYRDVAVYKAIINSNLYKASFAFLRKCNVTAKTLYGDLPGFCLSIRMSMQAYAAPDES